MKRALLFIKRPLVQPFFSSHAWESRQSVSNLPAAVKGGRHKTHWNFMHAWQVSTAYLARFPEWLPLQTASSTRDQKFRQAPGNLPSVSETMVSDRDMPDILFKEMGILTLYPIYFLPGDVCCQKQSPIQQNFWNP
jgi:hypothetical protein